MRTEYRDGLVAVCGLVGLTGLTAVAGGVEQLLDPRGIVAGFAAAVAIEVVFLRYSSWALGFWERPGVPFVSLCVVLGAGVVAVQTTPAVLSVPVWGLVTYLAILGCLLLGVGNPVSVLVPGTE